MKKILLLFAAMCCMMVANAYDFTVNGIGYKVTSDVDKTVEVVANGYYSGSIVIPAMVTNGDDIYSVTSIGYKAFYECKDLISVTLPEGLESIGEDAFYYCYYLTSVNIPSSVKSIGEYAFYYCEDLTSVTLPEGLENIEDGAFGGCYDLASVTIPRSVKSIGEYAFYYCEDLTSVTLPEGLENIGEEAFEYCYSLKSITIPRSVKSIGEYAFYYCYELTSISIAEGNTVYDSRGNCNAIIETATNTLIQGCNNTVIPSSVTTIGEYAFYSFDGLTSITIPNSVKSIGDYAFAYCDGLTSITIPSSVKNIGKNVFYCCEDLTSVTLQEGLDSIAVGTFAYCGGLTSITIPSSVTKIGNIAFQSCTGLKSITVLASNPPTLGGEDAFVDVNHDIPVYVPDVEAYSGWGGFTNFIAIDIDQFKKDAIAEINAAKEGVSMSEEEEDAIDGYIAAIEKVETVSDENLATIVKAKQEALTIISQAAIRPVREAALAAIEAAMQGETSDYLTGLVQSYIDAINASTDETYISNVKNTAVAVLNEAVPTYKFFKADILGSLGTKQNGPALIVTDQDGNEIILYSPKSVEYIKVNEK